MTFSLCMIVKNEEQTLARCLDSVKDVFDEIVIVDTGSVDATKKTAKKYTDQVFDFEWCDDFSAARNFAFSKATSDYLFWLDADDAVDEQNKTALLTLKQTLSPKTDVVMMKYATAFDELGNPVFLYYRERLIKRLGGMRWHGFVHEVIVPKGNIEYSDIIIFHQPDTGKRRDPERNLRIYEAYLQKGVILDTRESYYYARELYDNGKYDLCARHLEQFLKKPGAWYADKIGARLLLYHIYSRSQPEKAVETLTGALAYDTVSPQVLCYLGDVHKTAARYTQAIFWYHAALDCPPDYKRAGFVSAQYENYYPLLQLCVCYDALGETDKAEEYNRRAGEIYPDSKQVEFNNRYFDFKKAEKRQNM